MRKCSVILAASLGFVLAPQSTYAWNKTGHRAVALIAYRQLDEGTRQKVAALLRKNPTAYDRWQERKINSDTDAAANAFLNASTFPDDVRPPSRFSREFHHSTHHYVDFRYAPNDRDRGDGEPAVDEENILTTYRANLATLKSTSDKVSNADKAVALCWIIHQAGDIHQPLHAVARFSNTFPEGDRGGNLVKPFPNPRGSGFDSKNLHAYWDDLLGDDDRVTTFDKLEDIVAIVLSEFPRSTFSDEERKQDDIHAWAIESVDAAQKTVYRDLDPDIPSFDALPVAYEADAQLLARRRIALAGYRLAEVLNDLFGDAND